MSRVCFCCCEEGVCIWIGELKIQVKGEDERKIKWWLIDMARDVVSELATVFENSKFEDAKRGIKKVLEDLEALGDAVASDS